MTVEAHTAPHDTVTARQSSSNTYIHTITVIFNRQERDAVSEVAVEFLINDQSLLALQNNAMYNMPNSNATEPINLQN